VLLYYCNTQLKHHNFFLRKHEYSLLFKSVTERGVSILCCMARNSNMDRGPNTPGFTTIATAIAAAAVANQSYIFTISKKSVSLKRHLSKEDILKEPSTHTHAHVVVEIIPKSKKNDEEKLLKNPACQSNEKLAKKNELFSLFFNSRNLVPVHGECFTMIIIVKKVQTFFVIVFFSSFFNFGTFSVFL